MLIRDWLLAEDRNIAATGGSRGATGKRAVVASCGELKPNGTRARAACVWIHWCTLHHPFHIPTWGEFALRYACVHACVPPPVT